MYVYNWKIGSNVLSAVGNLETIQHAVPPKSLLSN